MAQREKDRAYSDDVDTDAPWLAPAGTGPQRTRVTRRSLFWTALVLLSLAAVATVGVVVLLSKKDGGSTQGYMNAEQAPLITAEPGPYKVLPIDPKGLAVEGQDQTIYQAGEGIDPGSTIDMSALPEQPLPRPGTAAVTDAPGPPRNLVPDAMAGTLTPPPVNLLPPAVGNPAAAPRAPGQATAPQRPPLSPAPAAVKPAAVVPAKPAATVTAKPAATVPAKPAATVPAKPAASATRPAIATAAQPVGKKSGTAQLGAFSSEAKANAAWAALTGRNPGLASFAKRLVPVESNGQTLWRLRASGGDATTLCASLKAGGFACTVIE